MASTFFQFVCDNPTKDWNWGGLSSNPNITWKNVQENPTKPWSWYGFSANPNISWQIVQENPTKSWDWNALSSNMFGWNNERLRTIQRTLLFRDELIEVTHHPARIQKWLDNGTSIEDLE